MAAKQPHTIHYGPDDWRAIRALNAYRWTVAIAAGVVLWTGIAGKLFTIARPELFSLACLVYIVLCAPSAWAAHSRTPALIKQVYVLVAMDLAFAIALLTATGGVRDGLGVLLFAPIAGASIMVRPRIAALFAAVASIALLVEESWRTLSGGAGEWAQTGMLGALLFIAAGVASTLARQARTSAALAAQHKSELDDLAALNQRIIQQMAIGLLVVDENRHIRMVNRAGRDMLDLSQDALGRSLSAAAPTLAWALQSWTVSPSLSSEPFTTGSRTLIPRFNRLGHGLESPVLIFLEDARRVSEQAQQIKLAALGRLTASIAHEIRNPLSAISQAGQLLDESDRMGEDEHHLLSIMHRQTRRLESIVQSVLGLSRRSQTLSTRLRLEPWLRQTVADYLSNREQPPRIVLEGIPRELEIQVNPNQLRQVLSNLYENAERHARLPDRELEVRITAGLLPSGEPYLEVADNGPGIADDVAEHLMEPFFTTDHDGTGLGLYVTRELCEYNFAHVALVDGRRGARFRVTFAHPDELDEVAAIPPTETVGAQ